MTPAVPSLGPRVSGLVPTVVNAILAEVGRVREAGTTVVSLMRGEPDFATPAHISHAAARSLADGRTSYPDNRGEPGLRDAIGAKLARDNRLSYDPRSEILVTTGATLGIHAALTALVGDGDEVLLPDPVYDAYQSAIRLTGARVRAVASTIERGRFVITAEALASAVTPASRALLLNTPWNPTGTVLREAELALIGDFVLKHDLVLISDEIYEAIVYDGHRHVSPATLSRELRARTVIVNSLSKTYAMTGWRIGYCAAPAPVVDAMFLVLQQSSRGPATFVQDAGAVALSASQAPVEDMRLEYSRRRDLVSRELGGLSNVRVLAPEGGFFAMVDVRDTGVPSDEIRRRLLHQHGVAVVHGAAYGPRGEGTLRISFGSGGESLARGLERLRAGLAGL